MNESLNDFTFSFKLKLWVWA